MIQWALRVVTFGPWNYTSGPFTSFPNQGTLSLGDNMGSASVDKKQRRGDRTKAVLPVRIKGTDSSGKVFDELVHTLDVTITGVRLGSIRRELNVADEITIFYRTRKMQFRVMWTRKLQGTTEFQVGLQALTQDREMWGISLATSAGAPAQPAVSQASGAA